MVMLGAVLACDQTVSKDAVWAALAQVVKSKPELLELNKRAIEAGFAAAAARSLIQLAGLFHPLFPRTRRPARTRLRHPSSLGCTLSACHGNLTFCRSWRHVLVMARAPARNSRKKSPVPGAASWP